MGVRDILKGFCRLLFIFFISISALWAIEDLGPAKDLFRVDDIKIEGLKKVESEAVLEKVHVKKGNILDNYLLRKDIVRIYTLKYFEFVEAHKKVIDGKNTLIFKVKEKPLISKISFEGLNEMDKDDLTTHIQSKEFSILDINTIKSDLKALQKQYEEKGFYLARINYEIRERKEDDNVELVFNVQEFEKVKVKRITFLGNSAFKDPELKAIMQTREEGVFSFMSGSGNFKEFNFQNDVELLKYFYQTKGYLQVNIGSPEITISEDRKWVFITMKVNEGPLFKVNSISFQGELLFSDEELLKKVKLKTGENYSEALLRQDIQGLTEMYQDEGYAFANVLRTLVPVPGENKVDVEFSFEKGKIAYFGAITVKGNTKTRDKVVRRELLIREGVKFSGSSLRRSKENVNRLGFFEPNSVIFNTVSPPGRDDVLDVEITVKERNTGQISLGAGFSTASGFFLQGSISQNNFMGLGQNLSFSVSWADDNKNFNLGFTEPYFLDTKWTAGGDVFYQRNESSESFSFLKKGFDARIGYPIFDYTRLFLTYKLEETEIKTADDPTIIEAVENGISSSVRSSIVYDKRDNKFEPSKGFYLNYAIEYSGLGFDKKWLKNEFDGRFYHRVYGDLVFRARLHAAKLERIDGQAIPRAEKFSLGGARNLRGFAYEAIGPKQTFDINGKQQTFNMRGLFNAYTTFELEHPLAKEAGLKWVLFVDAGDAGDYKKFKLHKDYGFGFRWFSPIGVLRFEFGYPIGEGNGSQFIFDIGQLF